MTRQEAYRELGLEFSATEEQIKTAYAHRCRECSPESKPEQWIRLHNAYKLLMSPRQSKICAEFSAFRDPHVEDRKSEFSEFDDLFQYTDNGTDEMAEEELFSQWIREESKQILVDWVARVCTLKKKEYLEADPLDEIFHSQEYKNLAGASELVEILLPIYQLNPYRVRPDARKCLQKQAVQLVKIPGISERARKILEYDARVYQKDLMASDRKQRKQKRSEREVFTTIVAILIVLLLTAVIPLILYGCGQNWNVVFCYLMCMLGGCFGAAMLVMHIKKGERPVFQTIVFLLGAILFGCGMIYFWR